MHHARAEGVCVLFEESGAVSGQRAAQAIVARVLYENIESDDVVRIVNVRAGFAAVFGDHALAAAVEGYAGVEDV